MPTPTNTQSRDERHALERRAQDGLTLVSSGILALVISGGLVFIVGGGLLSWSVALLGVALAGKGFIAHKAARRALR